MVSTTLVVNKDTSTDCENFKHFFHFPLLSVKPVVHLELRIYLLGMFGDFIFIIK